MIIATPEPHSDAHEFLRSGILVKQGKGMKWSSNPARVATWRQKEETIELVIGFQDHSELVVQISDVYATDPIASLATEPSAAVQLLRMLRQLMVLTDSIEKAVQQIVPEEVTTPEE